MQATAVRWTPKELVENAAKKSFREFSADYSARFLLVIPITDPGSELAQGLASTSKGARSLAFRTLQGDASTFLSAARKLPPRASQFPTHEWNVPGTYVPIPRHLLEAACFVVPISKRSGSAFLDRVSVGRAHGHDVVLRDPSVSKFHAWFELPEDGQLYLGDAGSRNHTFVNGGKITERTPVAAGAKVRFGLLDAHIYTLEAFWKSLRS